MGNRIIEVSESDESQDELRKMKTPHIEIERVEADQTDIINPSDDDDQYSPTSSEHRESSQNAESGQSEVYYTTGEQLRENKQSFGVAANRPSEGGLSDGLPPQVQSANNAENEEILATDGPMETQAASAPQNIDKKEEEEGGFYSTMSYYFGGWFGAGEAQEETKADTEVKKDTSNTDDMAVPHMERCKTTDRTPIGEAGANFDRQGSDSQEEGKEYALAFSDPKHGSEEEIRKSDEVLVNAQASSIPKEDSLDLSKYRPGSSDDDKIYKSSDFTEVKVKEVNSSSDVSLHNNRQLNTQLRLQKYQDSRGTLQSSARDAKASNKNHDALP